LVASPHAQVLLHRQPREDLAALRHEADAGAGALVRRGALDRASVELDAAGLDRHQAHQRLEQSRLAHAVAPQDDGDLAGLRLQAHVAQDVRAAVVLLTFLMESMATP
jgi:hypothetical protein